MIERYRIMYSQSTGEAMNELAKFIVYLKDGPVLGMLPSTLRDISVRDYSDVAKWQQHIERALRDTSAMSATERYWLNETNEIFKAARHRLGELLGASSASQRSQ